MVTKKQIKNKSDADKVASEELNKTQGGNIGSVRSGDLVFPTKLRKLLEDEDYDKKSACFIRLKPLFKKVVPNINEKTTKETLEDLKLNSIIMPILPVEDNIVNQWGSVEGAQLLTGELSFGKAFDYLKWQGMRAVSAAVPGAISETLKQAVGGGSTINPYDKVLYQGQMRRSIPLTFNFLKPESREDEKILRSIINIFRAYSVGSYYKLIIGNPIYWKVEFISYPDYENFLVYKQCGIENLSINFGSNGDEFKAMKSGMPFIGSISITFNEIYYPERNDLVF